MPSPKFNPASGKIELVDQDTHIGKPVVGGTPTHVLFVDASGNVLGSSKFTFDETDLKINADTTLTAGKKLFFDG